MTVPAFGDQNWDVQLRNNFNLIDSSMCIQTSTNTFTSSNTFTQSVTMEDLVLPNQGQTLYEDTSNNHNAQIFNAGTNKAFLEINGNDGVVINPGSFTTTNIADLIVGDGFNAPPGQVYGKFAVVGSSANNNGTYSGFTSTNNVSQSTLWSLPRADGTNGQTMVTDGSAHLSFSSVPQLSSTNTWTAGQIFKSSVTFSSFTVFNAPISTGNASSLPFGYVLMGNGAGNAPVAFNLVNISSFNINASTCTTVNSFVATNLSTTITPQFSASQILVTFSGSCIATVANSRVFLSLKRGSTQIGASAGLLETTMSGTNEADNGCTFQYIDTPATTSATTYTLTMKAGTGGNNVCVEGASEDARLMVQEIP